LIIDYCFIFFTLPYYFGCHAIAIISAFTIFFSMPITSWLIR